MIFNIFNFKKIKEGSKVKNVHKQINDQRSMEPNKGSSVIRK